MSLFKSQQGEVSHADAVPYVRAVPNKRDAERAYVRIISGLTFEQADDLGRDIELLRDFLYSR